MHESGARAYEDAYAQVVALVSDVPADRRTVTGVCGVWSLQDLMGHLAYWDQEQARELQALANGEPFVADEGDDINAREAARRRSWTWDDVMSEVANTHDMLVPLLIEPGEERVQYRIHEHWLEHLEQMREVMEQNND